MSIELSTAVRYRVRFSVRGHATLGAGRGGGTHVQVIQGVAFKGNVIDLAVGLVIGAAFGAIVTRS